MHHRVVRPITDHDTRSGIPARKRWGLAAGFVVAAIFPIAVYGTQLAPEAWAWVAFFSLNALIAAFVPETFF
jgi:hypothetical protein